MLTTAETLELYRVQFVESKRAAGIQYVWPSTLLKKFLTFAEPYLIEGCTLPKEAVLAWNNRRENEGSKTWKARIGAVRAFAEYLNAMGIAAYVSPPPHIGDSSYVPYVFSNDELARLFSRH
jgi:hypothetical protein